MKKLVLATVLGLVLTACSGGGGSKGGSSSSQNQPNTPIPQSSKSIDSVPVELQAEIRELKKITLDNGMVLDLADMPTGYLERNIDTGKVKGVNGVYYTFGTWVPYDLTYNEYGLPTNNTLYNQQRAAAYITSKANLPKNGTAVYEGQSLGAATKGKLRLEVDFGKNEVFGRIYERRLDNGKSLSDITLSNGHITHWAEGGTGFWGNAQYEGVNGKFDGNFAGPKAEEVMGRVTKDGAIYVGFGGKRGELKDVKKEFSEPLKDNKPIMNPNSEAPIMTNTGKTAAEIVDDMNKEFLESPLTKELINSLLN
ncbi:factor H binding protein domain-containing protein [Ursidibacter arcticus]